MTTARSAWLPYYPANPPGFDSNLPRATWEEFYRLAGVLAALDRPTAIAFRCIDTLTPTVTPGWTRLFDTDVTRAWEFPAGMVTDGVWTCPMEGLYQLIYSGQVSPATVPGSRVYSLEVRSTQTFSDGRPDLVQTLRSSGDDTEFLNVSSPLMVAAVRGDTVRIDARALLPVAGSPVTLSSVWHIVRIGGVR